MKNKDKFDFLDYSVEASFFDLAPYSLDDLKKVISEAWDATKILGKLDMTTEQRKHYEQNKSTLKGLCMQRRTDSPSNWIVRHGKWLIFFGYILYCLGIILMVKHNLVEKEYDSLFILITTGYIVASIFWIIKNRVMSKDALKPIDSAPSLETMNGIGTTIYGESLVLVFFGIPILWIARYSVENFGYSYSFHGKKRLRTWQIIQNVIVLSPITLLITNIVLGITL